MKKAQGYSKLFDSWEDITAKNGIAAAAGHSRIKELDRGILLVEIDHPGWKQILQTKQNKLLNDFRYRFPELDISGISLMLGRSEPQITDEPTAQAAAVEKKPEQQAAKDEPVKANYDAIKDVAFREKLIKIGKAIAEREKGEKHG